MNVYISISVHDGVYRFCKRVDTLLGCWPEVALPKNSGEGIRKATWCEGENDRAVHARGTDMNMSPNYITRQAGHRD